MFNIAYANFCYTIFSLKCNFFSSILCKTCSFDTLSLQQLERQTERVSNDDIHVLQLLTFRVRLKCHCSNASIIILLLHELHTDRQFKRGFESAAAMIRWPHTTDCRSFLHGRLDTGHAQHGRHRYIYKWIEIVRRCEAECDWWSELLDFRCRYERQQIVCMHRVYLPNFFLTVAWAKFRESWWVISK